MSKYVNSLENPVFKSNMERQINEAAVQKQILDEKNLANYLIKIFFSQKRKTKYTRYFHKNAF
jgi:hypothetical protein